MATDLEQIFERLRTALATHSPPFVARTGGVKDKLDYQPWSEKDVVIVGRPREDVYFAGLIVQKGYVGFYYMPVYAQPEIEELFAPELLALLRASRASTSTGSTTRSSARSGARSTPGAASMRNEARSRRLRPRRRAGRGSAPPQQCGC